MALYASQGTKAPTGQFNLLSLYRKKSFFLKIYNFSKFAVNSVT